MEKIRVGIIGCGGRCQSHIHSLLQMDDVEIVAIAEPVEERRLAGSQKTGAKRLYKDHNELFAHENHDTLDVLYICVEPTAHTDIEETAVEMGIPFLVEKPMNMDVAKAEALSKRIEEKGLLTAVGFQDRYLDLMEMVKEELPRHKAGGLVYGAWIGGIPGVWWWQKKSTCGGQLVEQNIHLADGLRWLYGEPLSLYATASRGIIEPGVDGVSPEYDTDDHSTVVIRFPHNVTATLVSACYSTTVRPACGFHITLSDMVIDYHLRNNVTFFTENETRDVKRVNDQTYDLDRAFITAIETGDASLIRSPYADALKSLKMCFAANESMETGKVIYFDN